MSNLVGKVFTFEDGNSIEVLQIKVRDNNEQFVTYQVITGPGIPRRGTMSLAEFLNTYGHLFPEISEDNT